eukprot:663355-Karenia_brevis.AAC.1
MIQGIEDQSIQVDSSIKADACSIEVGKKSWHVGAVERLPHAARLQSDRWEQFRRSNEDEEEEEDEESDVHTPHLESSSDESYDEKRDGRSHFGSSPSIEELRNMKVVTRRKKNLDKSKSQSK